MSHENKLFTLITLILTGIQLKGSSKFLVCLSSILNIVPGLEAVI
jgi:hypothetical protein